MDPTTAALEKEHEAITKVKYIDKIQIGKSSFLFFLIIVLYEGTSRLLKVTFQVNMKLTPGTLVLTRKNTANNQNFGFVNTASNICV